MKALLGTFNNDKALFWAFSGHCETSQRFVDSSSRQSECWYELSLAQCSSRWLMQYALFLCNYPTFNLFLLSAHSVRSRSPGSQLRIYSSPGAALHLVADFLRMQVIINRGLPTQKSGAGAGAGDPRHSIETQVFITSLCQRPPGQPLESEF